MTTAIETKPITTDIDPRAGQTGAFMLRMLVTTSGDYTSLRTQCGTCDRPVLISGELIRLPELTGKLMAALLHHREVVCVGRDKHTGTEA